MCEVRDGVPLMTHGYCWHTRERAESHPGLDAIARDLAQSDPRVSSRGNDASLPGPETVRALSFEG